MLISFMQWSAKTPKEMNNSKGLVIVAESAFFSMDITQCVQSVRHVGLAVKYEVWQVSTIFSSHE